MSKISVSTFFSDNISVHCIKIMTHVIERVKQVFVEKSYVFPVTAALSETSPNNAQEKF